MGGRQRDIARNDRANFSDVRLSPDERFLLLGNNDGNRKRFFIQGTGLTFSDTNVWPVIEGSSNDLAAGWSPDGTLLYFLLHRDGNRCLWAHVSTAEASGWIAVCGPSFSQYDAGLDSAQDRRRAGRRQIRLQSIGRTFEYLDDTDPVIGAACGGPWIRLRSLK